MDSRTAAHVLSQIASYLELNGESSFKVRAYAGASAAVLALGTDDLKPMLESGALAGVRGLGPATLAVVRDLVETGESRYLDAAERTLRAAWSTLSELPQGCPALLLALGDFLAPPPYLVIRYRDENAARSWRDALAGARAEAYFIAADAKSLPGVLARQDASAPVVAYLCRGTSCDPPLTSLDAFAAALRRLAD